MSTAVVQTESRGTPRLPFHRRLRVPALIGSLAFVSLVVYSFALTRIDAPAAALHVPWWAFIFLFFLTEAFPVHVHFRSEAHSLSLSELALVLGLYLASPGELLVAQLLGAAIALLAVRRQRPLKLGFNLACFAFATTLALLVFHGFLSWGDAWGLAGWSGALVAAMTNAVVGVLVVSVVIWLAAARSTVRDLPRLIGVAVCGSLASASLAIAALGLAQYDPRSLWVLVVPVVGTALAFRAYTAQRRRHEHLEFLYRSMRAMQGAPEFRSSVRELLEAARTMLSADVAEIVLFPRSPEDGALSSVITTRGEKLLQTTALSQTGVSALEVLSAHDGGVLLPRGRPPHELDAYLAERQLEDAIVTTLTSTERVFGMVLVGDRSGDVATFTPDDRQLFETFASHAGVLLENDRVKEQLRHQAFHDGLTGLPNRVLFAEQVRKALASSVDRRRAPTVLFVDLDDFKLINDSLGHSAGDQVLVAVAERVRAALRPGDLASRLGGDEFAILLDRSNRHDAENVATRLADALRAPFAVEGREVVLHASIGIAEAGPGDRTEDVLRNADVAMYSAKANGRGRYAWYELDMHVRARERQELVSSLQHAVERDEIALHFQPIVELASGRIVALEALARWRHPTQGLLRPEVFIALAEETGLMIPIGTAVLRLACKQLRVWQSLSPARDDLSVSVNLSLSELRNPSLIAEVETVLGESGLASDRLIIEMTESSAMQDPPAAIATLGKLARLGVRLALDDFGTGYSSLSHLREFPIDMLKIAKPFVDGIDRDSADSTFIDAILRLAGALRLDVVAEGIERPEQAEALRRLGCGLGQGYHYARPSEARVVGSLLEHETGRRRTRASLRVA